MTTPLSENSGSLIVFSWGAPDRLKTQINRIGTAFKRIAWFDPLCAGKPMPGLDANVPVERVEAVIGSKSATVELTQYSLRDLYSLAPAKSALSEIFPSLKVRRVVEVPVQRAAEVAKQIAALPAPLHIVIDLPGREHSVLRMLEQNELLRYVATVAMRSGNEAFFKRAKPTEKLVADLESSGFQLKAENLDDPDWPEHVFKIDLAVRRISELEAELMSVRAQARESAQALEARTAEFETARADLSAQAASLMDARARIDSLSQAQTETQARAAQMESDLTAANRLTSELRQAQSQASQALSERETALATKQSELDVAVNSNMAAQNDIAARDKSIEELKSALSTAEKGRVEAVERLTQLTQQFDAQSSLLEAEKKRGEESAATIENARNSLAEELRAHELSKKDAAAELASARDEIERLRLDASIASEASRDLEADLRQAQDDLRRSVSTLSAMQADYRDLRQRHAQIFDEKAGLEAVLLQLTPRLREAANQLRDISQSQAEIENQSQEPSETPEKTSTRRSRARSK